MARGRAFISKADTTAPDAGEDVASEALAERLLSNEVLKKNLEQLHGSGGRGRQVQIHPSSSLSGQASDQSVKSKWSFWAARGAPVEEPLTKSTHISGAGSSGLGGHSYSSKV